MRAPEPLRGVRVVADPSALDRALAALGPEAEVIRSAPDEALILGVAALEVEDPDAIIESETGFVAITVERGVAARHTEWPLPTDGSVSQGAVAGVPAKVTSGTDGRVRLITQAAYAADLLDRLA